MDGQAQNLEFEFETLVASLYNWRVYYGIPIPAAIAEVYKQAAIKRICSLVRGPAGSVPIRLAIIPSKEFGAILIAAKATLNHCGIAPGQRIWVRIYPDPAPDFVDIPEVWVELLAQDDELQSRWQALTPGKQRAVMRGLWQAKTDPTRDRKAFALAQEIKFNMGIPGARAKSIE